MLPQSIQPLRKAAFVDDNATELRASLQEAQAEAEELRAQLHEAQVEADELRERLVQLQAGLEKLEPYLTERIPMAMVHGFADPYDICNGVERQLHEARDIVDRTMRRTTY